MAEGSHRFGGRTGWVVLGVALGTMAGVGECLAKEVPCPSSRRPSILRPCPLRADLRCFPWRRRQLVAYAPPSAGAIRVAFFDADSTLRVTRKGGPAPNDRKDVMLLPMVAPKLRALADEGWLIAIVSNQGGIEKKFVSFGDAQGALRYTCRLLSKLGVPVHWFDFADRYDENRKPGVGMAFRLDELLRKRFGRGIDWRASMMIGDSAWKRGQDTEPDGHEGEDWSNSDRGFAESIRERLGDPKAVAFHHPRDFFGWTTFGVRNFHGRKDVESFLKRHPDLDPGVNGR